MSVIIPNLFIVCDETLLTPSIIAIIINFRLFLWAYGGSGHIICLWLAKG